MIFSRCRRCGTKHDLTYCPKCNYEKRLQNFHRALIGKKSTIKTAYYKGEAIIVIDVVGKKAYIRIPSSQQEGWIDANKLIFK